MGGNSTQQNPLVTYRKVENFANVFAPHIEIVRKIGNVWFIWCCLQVLILIVICYGDIQDIKNVCKVEQDLDYIPTGYSCTFSRTHDSQVYVYQGKPITTINFDTFNIKSTLFVFGIVDQVKIDRASMELCQRIDAKNPSIVILNCLNCENYITPVGSGISDAFTNEIRCYREGDYGATKWDTAYTSTIRSVKCQMLVQGSRCSSCAEDRRMLRKRQQRAEEKKTSPPVTFVHRTYQHKHMSRENLVTKIEQQKTEMRTLSSEVEKLKRQLHKQILQNGVTFSNPIAENIEMKDLMSTCQNDFEQAFPNPNSLQRLFWEQQIKFNSAGKRHALASHVDKMVLVHEKQKCEGI
ncbi:unnamed protein product [Mytilus edulis]|uniref:Uncharacterized protein n=1 Tax=Mytilus edulis TaxID=6550 RepID=A0A8S3U7D5_MYTED|nr:unnamed protein product [Mytilus edulis]